MNETVDPFLDWDAAYVLGALSMDDRRDFERHLASCLDCAAAVAELAGIPGILSKIDAETAVALTNSPNVEHLRDSGYEPLQKLARLANLQQRRMRRRLTAGMAAAAAALIVFGILTGTAIRPTTPLASAPSSNTSAGTVVAMSGLPPSVMTAELRVTSKPWGTRFDWSSNYGSTWAPGHGPQAYDLVITDAAGVETTIATWRAAGPGALGLAAASSVPTESIRTVEIRATGSVMPLVRGEL